MGWVSHKLCTTVFGNLEYEKALLGFFSLNITDFQFLLSFLSLCFTVLAPVEFFSVLLGQNKSLFWSLHGGT